MEVGGVSASAMAVALSGKHISLAALWTVASAVVAGVAYQRGLNHAASKSARVGDDLVARRQRDAAWGEGGEGGDETRLGENHEDIERVLSFWFAGSTRDNHRTKWFSQVKCFSSNVAARSFLKVSFMSLG